MHMLWLSLRGIKNYSEVLINYTNARLAAHAEVAKCIAEPLFRHFPTDKPQHVVATIGPLRMRAPANSIFSHTHR